MIKKILFLQIILLFSILGFVVAIYLKMPPSISKVRNLEDKESKNKIIQKAPICVPIQ